MSAYDYDAPPRRERSSKHYREDTRYADPQDPYLGVQSTRDVAIRPMHRDSDLSVEEVHRDFPPPGYARGGDVRRARSAEPYDYDDDTRSYTSRRTRGDYDDYYDRDYDRRPRRKAESVYVEEEEIKRKRTLQNQEKIIAALAGAAVAIGGKEFYDRREAKEEGYHDVKRNVVSSAALGAAGAFAAYQGAEFYNKRADKSEKKSTHIVHKGRDGRVTEYYSDDEDEKQKKGNKNFLESALAAAGLGGAVKALTGGSGDDDRHRDRDRDRDRDSRSDTRSRRGSRGSRSPSPTGGNKIQKAAMASLIAGATEAFRVSKEPGSWKGEKAKRVFTAAAGAAAIDTVQKPGKDGSKLGLAESVIGGLIGNRMINGSKRDIIEDKGTGRSRSRSRARSESRGGGGGGVSGLAALATAGLGAIGAKKVIENHRDRSRSRRRDDSVSSYDSRDVSPKRSKARSRSRSVVDTARRGLARIGLGKGEDDERRRDLDDDYDSPRGSSRRDRELDVRSSRGGYDDYDDDARSYRARSRSRGRRGAASRASSRGSISSSDLGDSDEDEKRAKKMRGKQIITTGLAAVATIHAAHNVYQSMEKRNARHKAVKEGRLSPAEARKLKSKALLQDAASVGIAALGIKGAVSELKEAREMSHEVTEWREEKEKRHQRRLERLQQRSRSSGGGSDDYYGRSRADNYITTGPPRASRYDDRGPPIHYSDGNPYAALPAPPVGYDSRR